MEFIQKLIRRKDRSKPQDKINTLKELEVFKRLQVKFTGVGMGVRSGLNEDQLSVGDLVDILDLYLRAAESDTRGKCSTIARIVEVSFPVEQLTLVAEELKKLKDNSLKPSDLNRTYSLYSLPINLRRVTEEDLGELSHYPGGIMITELKDESYKPTGKYTLLLTNRQQADNENLTRIKQIFGEVGLPVK
ncbi:hypothetical protein A3A46_03335 [Candidatus Roizmanbacteria bacterium RIFCSPLOWO2_01_FULL_37_13]|uniref:Uncharacterized protein n=1 Tax=Candidatus Roizmanbacteria bacterium RIFCSPHIGHO2_02_FULL_38_11 TaxID=1802039 RepID=A0A1F7GX03_9BACT|nr:MAG: hypothetical protein A3C25_02170 [Candidatus Roizmanbacteria bacterium RIFCSPHIGHO2_02_FULL_38_11]OGK43163.1 MAG: hypothetical protein A3A46_03335 [Candidatus Roizmanbacteria bacterium RIFCSPLOWO2_01_FULL_37_13]